MADKPPKTTLRCYVCRKDFAHVLLNDDIYFPIWYDFCIQCEELMRYDMERQMVGLPAKSFKDLENPRSALRLVRGKKDDDA
jgi:hypothetical protein